MRVALLSLVVLASAPASASPRAGELELNATTLPSAPLPRSALASPLRDGFPSERLRSRALVKLTGLSRTTLQRAFAGGDAARVVRARLADVERRTGYALHVVRTMPFDWLVVDVTPAGTPTRLDEAATLRAVHELARHKDLVDGASDERWYRTLATPNDPGMSYAWNYDVISAETAWDIATGDAAQRVGVVDTGTVRVHQDLSGKDASGYDFISFNESSNDGDGRDGDYDDAGDGGDCGNDSWHGSHVAGTVLASTGNGVGIAGVNWSAQLVTGRALGECGGSSADILEAVAWMSGYIIDDVPNIDAGDVVDVINLSLGQNASCSNIENDYITTIMTDTDVVFVGAAGNSGNGEPVGAPANCPGVISVGAHGPTFGRNLAPYSNFSSDLDVIAPGGDIQSSGVVEDGVLSACGPSSDCYVFQQGTSMAAPHVTGAVSLLRAANPTLTAQQITDLLRGEGATCSGCDGVPALDLGAATAAAAELPGGVGVPEPEPEPPGGGVPSPGEPQPPTAPEGACDPLRGNWDCDNGYGCQQVGEVFECVAGAEGDVGSGGLCDDDGQCKSGLCDNGVCTVPCDDGCRDGYRCEEALIPGGLCRAESCLDSEGDICQIGWHCAYTDADRYACATEGEDVFAPLCACVGVAGETPPVVYFALLLLGGVFVRRRRR